MALNAYLNITGAKTGKVKGSVIQKGRENKILIISASHEVISPYDANSGQTAGPRMHKPFIVRKELDQSTPVLYQLLSANENLTTCEIEFYAPNKLGSVGGQGVETLTYVVKLTNAHISNIKFAMPNIKDPELVRYENYEEISFVYQTIEWIWKTGNKSATDNW